MDAIIFLLILGTFALVLRGARRGLVVGGFLVCLAAALLLFNHHVTSPLHLNF